MTPKKLWFEVKVAYDKVSPDDGIQRVATESYLVDAFSFSEAESIAVNEAQPFTSGQLMVQAIKRAKISEVFENTEAEAWYKAKVYFITLNEKNGKEKKTANYMLVQADDIEEARNLLVSNLKTTMSTWEIGKIEDTGIVSVIEFKED